MSNVGENFPLEQAALDVDPDIVYPLPQVILTSSLWLYEVLSGEYTPPTTWGFGQSVGNIS